MAIAAATRRAVPAGRNSQSSNPSTAAYWASSSARYGHARTPNRSTANLIQRINSGLYSVPGRKAMTNSSCQLLAAEPDMLSARSVQGSGLVLNGMASATRSTPAQRTGRLLNVLSPLTTKR
jgi:hypothetical protein